MREDSESIRFRVLSHMLRQVARTRAETDPFAHAYFEGILPADLYARLLDLFPEPALYCHAAQRYQEGEGNYVRTFFNLNAANLGQFRGETYAIWAGISSALLSPELKEAIFECLAPDLIFRYGVDATAVRTLPGFAMPTLYREVEGFEIPPHPDTRKKVVTMQLYLPRDCSQLNLGTALFRRKLVAWPFGSWHGKFSKVKQFPFAPNSGYAFVVNNSLTKKSWHGREQLPPGAGVRNTLLTTFYEKPKQGFHVPTYVRPAAAA